MVMALRMLGVGFASAAPALPACPALVECDVWTPVAFLRSDFS